MGNFGLYNTPSSDVNDKHPRLVGVAVRKVAVVHFLKKNILLYV